SVRQRDCHGPRIGMSLKKRMRHIRSWVYLTSTCHFYMEKGGRKPSSGSKKLSTMPQPTTRCSYFAIANIDMTNLYWPVPRQASATNWIAFFVPREKIGIHPRVFDTAILLHLRGGARKHMNKS
ncbi:hypothetical protein COCCADRAFT_84247, partial [Bipolaris zeicola 26-R-13]